MSELPIAANWQNPELVQNFLQNVRGAIPLAIEQIDMMLRLLGAARERIDTFLDLGCGDGVLAAAILDEYPHARGLLIDESDAMLNAARRRLDRHADRVEFIRADFHQPGWTRELAGRPSFDALVSAFAIHRANDERKRQIYREIFDLLSAEGLFLNFEHVASATRWTESVWDDYLIDAIFGQAIQRSPGKTRAEIARDYYDQATLAGQSLAPLEVQCDWLREIGFEHVECFLKIQELAVFGGQRGGAGNGDS
jgi:ubiquinone/menaquinone biosynthesis C-methylase UbiE